MSRGRMPAELREQVSAQLSWWIRTRSTKARWWGGACRAAVAEFGSFRDDDGVEIATVAERPELTELAWERTRDPLPEYNNYGDVLNGYWGQLTEERPDFQFHLLGDDGDIVARARSIPVRWDGSVNDLPVGIDGASARGFDEGGANVLCALVIMVPRDIQGRGVSAAAVKAMAEIARRHGLGSLIAPVRPSWKDRSARPSSDTPGGDGRTASCSTRGCASTSGLARGCSSLRRDLFGSPAVSPSGSSGRRCRSRRAATIGSPAASRP